MLKADSSQPEFTRPVWEYLDGAVSSSRIGRGRVLLAQHNAMLQRIEQQYGVEAQILVAIWGLESNFGNNIGSHSVIRPSPPWPMTVAARASGVLSCWPPCKSCRTAMCPANA